MRDRLIQAIGVTALLAALLSAGTVVAVVSASVGMRLHFPAVWSANLGSIYLADSLLAAILAAGLWRLERAGTAASLFAAAAVIAALDLVRLVAFASGVHMSQTMLAVVGRPFNWLGLTGSLCLGAGLLIGRRVPNWVGWCALSTPLLRAAASLVSQGWSVAVGGATLPVGGLFQAGAAIMGEVFLIGLGVVLLSGESGSAHSSNQGIEQNASR